MIFFLPVSVLVQIWKLPNTTTYFQNSLTHLSALDIAMISLQNIHYNFFMVNDQRINDHILLES